MGETATLECRCKRRMAGSGSSGKKLGPLPSTGAQPTVTCSAGQGCSNKWRKELLSLFLWAACSAIPQTQQDTSATDWPVRWYAPLMDANTHWKANPSYTRTQKAKTNFFLLNNNRYFLGGGWVCPGGVRAQGRPKPFGAIRYLDTLHWGKVRPWRWKRLS